LAIICIAALSQSAAAFAVDRCPGYESDARNQVVGTPASDFLQGTSGDDVICGMGGSDRLVGNGGADVLVGDSADTYEGFNTLFDDWIIGGPGDDVIRGGNGSDVMWGSDGSDRIFGERGRDYLIGGYGPDFMSGGEGPPAVEPDNDPFNLSPPRALDLEVDEVLYQLGNDYGYERRSQPIVATLDGLPDDGQIGEADFIASDVEGVEGGDGNDLIVGDDRPNTLYGLGGDDTIIGGGGFHDFVYGGGGSDLINLHDANGGDDPSGSLPGDAIPVGEFDDQFSCDLQGTQSGPAGAADLVVADWEDQDADDGTDVGCEHVEEPSHLVTQLVNGAIPLPALCAGSSRCKGSIQITWAGAHGRRRSTEKRFNLRHGHTRKIVRVPIPKATNLRGRRLRLRVRGKTPALGIARPHRVELRG
jgi:Ca2+-binding RTX toxin-like protein